MALVCPSLRGADFARLGEQLSIVREAGARMVHVDVTDGHVVPEVSFGLPVVESIRKATDLTLDVHLLIERPERFVRDFIAAGADRVAVHPETTADLYGVIHLIRSGGAIAGVALRPAVPVDVVTDVLADLDFLNLLSADLGEAEENYIPYSTFKLRSAAALRDRRGGQFSLQLEGGIEGGRVREILDAGANILVVGAPCFSQADPGACLKDIFHRVSEATGEIERPESYLGSHEV
jgi:ribulose-phosphate 3-epimerase